MSPVNSFLELSDTDRKFSEMLLLTVLLAFEVSLRLDYRLVRICLLSEYMRLIDDDRILRHIL